MSHLIRMTRVITDSTDCEIMAFVLRDINSTSNPTLARAYGKQSTKGLVTYFERDGDRTKFILLLCQGGKYGCDGIDKYLYNGYAIDPANYVFHPGTLSTGYSDPVQGRPTFFPNLNFTFSGICYLEVFLPSVRSPADAAATPDGSEVYLRGLKVMHYEIADGKLQETAEAFSANPILVGIDDLIEVGQISLLRFQTYAQTWIDGVNICDFNIDWDKGADHGGVVSIPRFEAHIAFSQNIEPFLAFNQILALCPGMKWQDVNGGLRLLPSLDRDPVHTFIYDPTQTVTPTNVVRRGLNFTPRDPSVLYNFYIISYRDLDNENYKQKYVYIDYGDLRDAVGGILIPAPIITLGVMRQSQAERAGWYTARSVTGWYNDAGVLLYPAQIEVKGQVDSYHVAKCDNVLLAHDLMEVREADAMLCTVLKESFDTPAGQRSFTIQLTDRTRLYKDTDHTVVQGTGATFAITTSSPLPAAAIDVSYSVFLQGSGGTTPYSWSVTSGALPTGLILDSATGEISGIPTSAVGSPYIFTITLTDLMSAMVGKSFSIIVS